MDYKYIEQLLERYFQAETTVQEEQMLRIFFSQDALPAHLEAYKPLFSFADAALADERLGDDFDQRLLALTQQGGATTKARVISLRDKLAPLLRAAAIVAVVLTLGNAMRYSAGPRQQQADDINYADYMDTYDDPSVAYDHVENALRLINEGMALAQAADTLAQQAEPAPATDAAQAQ